jgi:hypothetical protein
MRSRAQSFCPGDRVSDSPTTKNGGTGEDRKNEGAQLITAAFEQARESGKPDWRAMRSAVLKNRILSLDENFDEQKWEVGSFRAFVEQYPDLIEIDATFRPPVVRLREQHADEARPTTEESSLPTGRLAAWTGPRLRIRPDLWQAVLDVATPEPYFWDGTAARRGPADTSEGLMLPTASPDDLRSWRQDFVAQVRQTAGNDEPLDPRLSRWESEPTSSRTLYHPLRARWMAYLKRRVQERLEGWFREHELEPPEDLVSAQAPGLAVDAETEQLRGLIIGAIEEMGRAELEELRLPARAMLRARRLR